MEDNSRFISPVVAAYLNDVDRTLLRANLRLSPEDRIRKLQDFVRTVMTLRAARKPSQTDGFRGPADSDNEVLAELEALREEREDGH
jgi:hypothetical protein